MNLPPPQTLMPDMNPVFATPRNPGFFQLPQLVVLHQNSLSEEKCPKSGGKSGHQMVHVVVKNSPFVISLGISNNSSIRPDMFGKYMTNSGIDMGKLTFDCKLLYDTEGPETEVDFISNKPFMFKVNVLEGGQQVDIEVRLKVLSSQHEDMFFRVKFVALDPITKQEVAPSLVVLSAPIKVISKPEQLKKRRPSKKRTLNDALIESLNRIERRQNEHQRLIDKLTDGEFDDGSSPAPVAYPTQYPPTQQAQQQPPIPQQQSSNDSNDSSDTNTENAPVDFESALGNLLQKYTSLPEQERPKKIQKLLHRANISRENLSEMNDLFQAEGMQQAIGREVDRAEHTEGKQCLCPSCPHKMELERIELFYKDVFHL